MNQLPLSGASMNRRDFTRIFIGGSFAMLAPAPLLGAARMPSPTVGLAIGTYGMKELSTPEALRLLCDTGYDGVQLALMPGWPTDPATLTGQGRRELRKQIEDSGLGLPSMLESLPLTGNSDAKAKNLDRLKRAIELGNELTPARPPFLDTILGRKTVDWDKVKHAMADELRTWVPILDAGNTTIVFKPHIGHAVNSPERSLWLINAVGSARIRIVYDYSHFHVEGLQLEDSLRQLIGYSPFIVVKDSKGTPSNYEYLLPGEGMTDYLAYFQLLKELRYSGYVNVEVSAHIHRKPGYQAVQTVKVCYERLAPLFERAGLVRPVGRKRRDI
jgi:sugar phosphate isomerase/epimerase